MQKTGYCLVKWSTREVVQQWNDTTSDADSPHIWFNVPGRDLGDELAVHCPKVGKVYGGDYALAERYEDNVKPSKYHTELGRTTLVESKKKVVIRVEYPEKPNVVPQTVSGANLRKALRAAGHREAFDYIVAEAGHDAYDEWEYAYYVVRSGLVAGLLDKLPGANADDLFRAADSHP